MKRQNSIEVFGDSRYADGFRARDAEITALKAQRDALLTALEPLVAFADASLTGGVMYDPQQLRQVAEQARAAIKGAKT